MDSSTDSEDEVLQRFQQSSSLYNGLRKISSGDNCDADGGNVVESHDTHRSIFSSTLTAYNGSSSHCTYSLG